MCSAFVALLHQQGLCVGEHKVKVTGVVMSEEPGTAYGNALYISDANWNQ